MSDAATWLNVYRNQRKNSPSDKSYKFWTLQLRILSNDLIQGLYEKY